jgi:hypothetical protein
MKTCKCNKGSYERPNEYGEIQICCNQCHRTLGNKQPVILTAEEKRFRQWVNRVRSNCSIEMPEEKCANLRR